MKLKTKIILLCVGIYVFSIFLVAVVVTEQIYTSTLNREIQRCLEEESSMYASVNMYLRGVNNEAKISIADHIPRIHDLLKRDNLYLDFYSEDMEYLLSSGRLPREKVLSYIQQAYQGRNYVLTWYNGKHYILINDIMETGNLKMPFTYIKDISEIEQARGEHYFWFAGAGIVGLILVVSMAVFLSGRLLNPINQLGNLAGRIAAGKYDERVPVTADDEIGILADKFNLMAASVEQHVKELKNEDERKQRFIDNFSHEMRTPMTAILGYAEMLKKIKYDEKVFFKGLNYIHAEGLRLQRLYTMLLNITLIRETNLDMEKVKADLIIKDALQMMAPLAVRADIKLVNFSKDLDLYVNRDFMKDVLGNLIENAVNASSAHTSIIVGCNTGYECSYIYVKDEGCGMNTEQIEKISEPFYRVDKSRSRSHGGLGLGMAICRDIVEKHGAKLDISSTIGLGTEVRIVWPLEKSE